MSDIFRWILQKQSKFLYCISYSCQQLISLSFLSLSNFTFHFFSLKLTATGDKPFRLLAMEQNHERDNSKQKSFGEKSNKCNLCDYATSNAGHLRTHVKMHSGEKSNKCNLCDFASNKASDLRRHLKTHSGEKMNTTSVILDPSKQAI